MRRRDLEIVDIQEIEGILRSAPFCRLAMVDAGMPYVVPLSFGYEDGRLFFHSAASGRKLDVIRRCGRVCFEITSEAEVVVGVEASGSTVRYSSVIGTGIARELEDPVEKRHALEILAGHYRRLDGEISAESVAKTAVIEVAIESMTGKRNPG
jgi:nitroimidazol reductase NimA-like FMN-containing flavoprotein (pyridoxamine 5'-phosphate oxidase superfamily)